MKLTYDREEECSNSFNANEEDSLLFQDTYFIFLDGHCSCNDRGEELQHPKFHSTCEKNSVYQAMLTLTVDKDSEQ